MDDIFYMHAFFLNESKWEFLLYDIILNLLTNKHVMFQTNYNILKDIQNVHELYDMLVQEETKRKN